MIFSTIALIITTLFPSIDGADPVSWTFDTNRVGADEYELSFKATIQRDWVIYALDTPDGGPIATSFYFDEIEGIALEGDLQVKSKVLESQDDLFDMVVRKHKREAVFVQKVKITKELPVTFTGELEFMTCDGERCLPPTPVPFSITIQ